MITAKPKINRYFSSAQSVPVFKNPNSSINLSSLIAICDWQQTKTNSPKSNVFGELETYKGTEIKGFTYVQNNLVFLNKKGSHTPNPNLITYNFPGAGAPKINSKLMTLQQGCHQSKLVSCDFNVYKLLSVFFKSMYCLISKPVFIETPDKIKIQLFYFLCIPKILIKYQQSLHHLALEGNDSTSSKANSAVANSTSLNFSKYSGNLKIAAAKTNKNKYLLQQLKNFNSKNLKVKFILNNLSQPSSCSITALPFKDHLQPKVHATMRSLPLQLEHGSAAEVPCNDAAGNLTKVFPKKFKLICSILSKLFNKSVELDLIRLHQPYYDSNILVNFLALIINKKNIGAAIQRLYNSNIIKSGQQAGSAQQSCSNLINTGAYLSGLNIKIGGRLMREPIIPRVTAKKFEKGFTAKGKINYSDIARFTHKNRKGAFSITVKSGQKFF